MVALVASGIGHDLRSELRALCAVRGIDWNFIAREALAESSVSHFLEGRPTERSPAAKRAGRLIESSHDSLPERLARAGDEIGWR